MFDRKIFELIGYMKEVQNYKGTNGIFQDHNYWKDIINHSKIYYTRNPLIIYYKKLMCFFYFL